MSYPPMPVIRKQAEGRNVAVVGDVYRFMATGDNTNGKHALWESILAETEQGRGILGVVDGFSPKGVEDEGEIKWRKDFLRQIGYKL